MEFKIINEMKNINEIDIKSNNKLQVIFKHSTTCSVSFFIKKSILNEMVNFEGSEFDIYYLDLLAFRNISNAISSYYSVKHESPQILIIENGKCIYNASHSEVSLEIDLLTLAN